MTLVRLFLAIFWILHATNGSLTDYQKQEILEAHNHYRGLVDPIATDMLRMEWDEELSYIAQFWAANCYFGFNEKRDFQSSHFDYVGENLANTTGNSVNYTLMVDSWFSMGKRYNFYQRYCRDEDGSASSDGERCSSYRQLVWAQTHSIGCGAMRCENLYGRETTTQNALFLVCDYGPGGSFEGRQPYASGYRVCSSCPSSRPRCINKLCSRRSGAKGLHYVHIFLQILLIVLLQYIS